MITRGAAIAVLVATSAASAGPYAGFAIGPAPRASESTTPESVLTSQGLPTERVIVGFRYRRLSVEGAVLHSDLVMWGLDQRTWTEYDLAVKYSQPLGHHVEAFARAGFARTDLPSMQNSIDDWSGDGWLVGAGLEYHLHRYVSILADVQYSWSSLTATGVGPLDARVGVWSLGLAFGG